MNVTDQDDIDRAIAQLRREFPQAELDSMRIHVQLQRLARLVDMDYQQWAKTELGINGSDLSVLFALRKGGPPFKKRPTDLYKYLLVTSGAITKQLDRLVAKGLVVREPDSNHARGFLIHLTDAGHKLLARAIEKSGSYSRIAPVIMDMPAKERKAGERFLRALMEGMEEG